MKNEKWKMKNEKMEKKKVRRNTKNCNTDNKILTNKDIIYIILIWLCVYVNNQDLENHDIKRDERLFFK